MSKQKIQLSDINHLLDLDTDSKVVLKKIAVPNTTITNRAQVTDFANDLKVRFGNERYHFGKLHPSQDERDNTGLDPVFIDSNDRHDAVRFVGDGWSVNLNSTAGGHYHQSSRTTDYIEIVFYGTGLNLLGYAASPNYGAVASIDGGAEGSNFWPNVNPSATLHNNLWNVNQVINVVNGLSFGLHTARIRTTGASGIPVYGYEVISEVTTLRTSPGKAIRGGQSVILGSADSQSYSSGFASGTLGTKGGKVVVYLQDGAVKKALTPTDSTAQYLVSANHTNEEVRRLHFWREFAVGNTGTDMYGLTTSPSGRGYCLNDGTTNLWGENITVDVGGTAEDVIALNPNNGAYIVMQFVGTGLDIIRWHNTTGSNAATALEVFVDGISRGYLSSTGSTTKQIEKICSGLPYGTHTVKILRNSAAAFYLGLHSFIVYGPKTPTVPSDAVKLAEYNIMSDFTAIAAAGVERVATGVLRKQIGYREANYAGTWSSGLDTNHVGGRYAISSTVGATARLDFFGTGIDLRLHASSSSNTATITLNGTVVNDTNFTIGLNGGLPSGSGPTIYITTMGGISFDASTGVISNDLDTPGSSLAIRGLTPDFYKMVLTTAGGTGQVRLSAFDIITPLHNEEYCLPGNINANLLVGSQSVSDKRGFFDTQVRTSRAWAQTWGVLSDPASSASVPQVIFDMNCVIRTTGKPLSIEFSGSFRNASTQTVRVAVYVGLHRARELDYFGATKSVISGKVKWPVPAGVHLVTLRFWSPGGGASTADGISRTLTVEETD